MVRLTTRRRSFWRWLFAAVRSYRLQPLVVGKASFFELGGPLVATLGMNLLGSLTACFFFSALQLTSRIRFARAALLPGDGLLFRYQASMTNGGRNQPTTMGSVESAKRSKAAIPITW
ncbi:hypothetical protein L3X38_033156 [Prunus dulcis]|uniref:Uncharacterized protein n=1 Tax=Prunus dulcis TaxID=3755 RepID=A0AAD4YXC7_PRUDU|nr:hypothetical protein L3X38_033156 [Prunus dulcis]